MISVFKKTYAGKVLKKYLFDIPPGLRVVNFIFQRLLRINTNCPYQVHFTSQVRQGHNLRLGKTPGRCLAVMSHCNIQAHNGVEIGEGTVFASGLSLISANHDLHDIERGDPPYAPPIIIGAKCWIGCEVTILPGVTIGTRSVIGAGSVVTKNIPDGVVAAGNPAVVIRHL